ncbi:MAG: hypothetical protein HOP29_12600 [Phycisphaerales bacterium]|nr:hypothetical protein [Phycisphaerales bacterium]
MGSYLATARRTLERLSITESNGESAVAGTPPGVGSDEADVGIGRHDGADNVGTATTTPEVHDSGMETSNDDLYSPAGHAVPRIAERWPLSAEVGLPRCRACHGAIQFGEVQLIHDSNHPDGRKPRNKSERWIKLDPDLTLHGCGTRGAGRIAR